MTRCNQCGAEMHFDSVCCEDTAAILQRIQDQGQEPENDRAGDELRITAVVVALRMAIEMLEGTVNSLRLILEHLQKSARE